MKLKFNFPISVCQSIFPMNPILYLYIEKTFNFPISLSLSLSLS